MSTGVGKLLQWLRSPGPNCWCPLREMGVGGPLPLLKPC